MSVVLIAQTCPQNKCNSHQLEQASLTSNDDTLNVELIVLNNWSTIVYRDKTNNGFINFESNYFELIYFEIIILSNKLNIK